MGKRKMKVKDKIFFITKKNEKGITSKKEFADYYANNETILFFTTYGKELIHGKIKQENTIQYKNLTQLTISSELRSIALKWIYSIISDTSQSRIKHKVSRVFVVMASPFFIRCIVFADIPCLKIN